MFLVALVVNFLWEMMQMSAYSEMRDRPWVETVPACALAAFGDAVIMIVLYSLVSLAFCSWRWWGQSAWKNYAAVASLGFVSAVLFERLALTTGYWSYAESMPKVPGLNVGLWPLLQLTILAPLAIRTAASWSRR